MSDIVRFGVSLEEKLLFEFDLFIRDKGYENRSEAIRDLIRERLVNREWELDDKNENVEQMAVLTIVYDHHHSDLPSRLTDLQHSRHGIVHSTLHIHLDQHNCLEIVVFKGRAREVLELGERLISTRGVKHGKMILTTTGRSI